MKTFFAHLDRIAVTVNTDGTEETFTFKTKKAADKKLLKLMAGGYTFDRFGWAARTSTHEFVNAREEIEDETTHATRAMTPDERAGWDAR